MLNVLKQLIRTIPIQPLHQIAQVIASHYDVLKRILPPKRKIWMSEDTRMSVFKSIALIWVCYYMNREYIDLTH
ncbi:MAG: hypothetical protein COV57_03410 [Candidatus Liptonbacteria bacterium CG11_big_fil_rev_8_21_14_0_20_35_14]|uniref:Uncharacterized protein n=1 Tax=Candidatus Liptonbacteria bacterium CG11_big_fil_rev_8_21_14_0_20_35_14 TaxID=1974634 RepID=A0A2H0N920_9BACT|nr:MAG: hypothetical protein COV57_03410 [Candidatus Liptonbacteria bacterium CG11_big_fil_rev_8_21_14_0_20_35_14]